ncbi:ATP-dependent zinc metalloprotease FtsH [Patescibacteria group bacterium]|nr:ATP-dependent zinc metalloprotease FtsH [Patescibacteria group bacterium]MBU4082718.1 ATP-dependent zinc metalloprotease FtsH [Patescibacteria group bacterium]MCG2809162.1 ATP-dependent zinc metalloprotease FtsH [Candidatus Portnoybacteria bacterium]
MKTLFKNLLIAFLVFLSIAGFFALINSGVEEPTQISLTQLVERINNEEISTITIKGDALEIKLKGGTVESATKEREASLTESLKNYGLETAKLKLINLEVEGESGAAFWLGTVLPFLFPLLLIGAFFWFMLRGAQRGQSQAFSFGRSRARLIRPEDKKNRVSFKDVAGLKEAKEELSEIVEFLRTPKKFVDLGAKIPKGVLLIGAPGTGKTLLARAIASEASVPFFSVSGSEFVEMFVGVGSSRVRDLFQTAKKNAPSLIFIDELDAIGRQRGAGLGGGHDEREQTLNQILVEMDGFDPNTGVILISATNRPDVLDQALLRPGRFDRRIILDLPDIKDREAILKIHSLNKPMGKDANFKEIAERTPGFSGADLANLVNEAAILTARRNKKIIGQSELLECIEKVILGPERKSHILSKKEKEITAYHEAGHALLTTLLPNADPVQKVSIIARGSAAGYTLKLPIEDKHLHSRSEFMDELAVLLGGYAAEKIVFNELTTGASNDLQKTNELARRLVTKYGMSEKMGPRTFGGREEMVFLGREMANGKDYSEEIAKQIDEEIAEFIDNAYRVAEDILIKNRKKLDRIAKELIKKETIERKDFERLLKRKV